MMSNGQKKADNNASKGTLPFGIRENAVAATALIIRKSETGQKIIKPPTASVKSQYVVQREEIIL